MPNNVYKLLEADVRLTEGLKACMNCGICTAICPAAEFYDYDPRSIATAVQSGNDEKINALLSGNEIWYCGQCMSCKTRCPRGNCPGLVITALRKISQESGKFTDSKFGRQQYLIVQSIGASILEFGYCLHPSSISPEAHPEQGTVWEWVFNNLDEVYAQLDGNLNQDGAGTLRRIPEASLKELHQIFEVTGGFELMRKINDFSQKKALEMGFTKADGQPDMSRYSEYLLTD